MVLRLWGINQKVNHGAEDFQSSALPTELTKQNFFFFLNKLWIQKSLGKFLYQGLNDGASSRN
jgi:hypothetical protein